MKIPFVSDKVVAYKNALFKTFAHIEKRLRFVISAVIMALIMLISTFFFFDKAYFFIPVLIIATYIFTFFSILQGVEKVEWFTLFLMPIILTVVFYLFYLLFPVRWLTRLPFICIYGFSLYAILLTSNIFNVGVEKSLQLYRAAFSVNYFYQTIIVFLVSSVIFSFRLNPLSNGVLMFIFAFLLSIQLFWSVKPKIYLEKTALTYSFLISIILFQMTLILSFMPIKLSISALFTTALYYSSSGLLYHHMEQKLFSQTIREYTIVLAFVFGIVLLSLQW